jgi:hypothetical protein
VRDSGSSRIEDRIRLRDMRPFRTTNREYLPAKKSVFDKIVPEAVGGGFELAFAKFLERAPDVVAYAKNYLALGFKIDYVNANGDISNYIPDFFVKTSSGHIVNLRSLRLASDAVLALHSRRDFRSHSFINEVIWSTPGGGASGRRFSRKHYTLLVYSKATEEGAWIFNTDAVRVEYEPGQQEMPLQFEERWTGGYIFENEWQSFRTRKSRDLELVSAEHTYDRPGRYTVAGEGDRHLRQRHDDAGAGERWLTDATGCELRHIRNTANSTRQGLTGCRR